MRLRHKWLDNPREICFDAADWIHLLQYRAHWKDFMNTLKNLQISKMQGVSWPTFKEQLTSACFYYTQIVVATVCCMLSDRCKDHSHTVQAILQTTVLLNI